MLERSQLSEKQLFELNFKVNHWIHELSAENDHQELLKKLETLPDAFKFSRDTIFQPITLVGEGPGQDIFFNYAARIPALFKYVMEHTADHISNEAACFQQREDVPVNTVTILIILESQYVGLHSDVLEDFVRRIDKDNLARIASDATPLGPVLFFMLLLSCHLNGKISNLMRAIIDKLDSAVIDRVLFMPVFGLDITVYDALSGNQVAHNNLDSSKIFLLFLEKVTPVALNNYFMEENNHSFNHLFFSHTGKQLEEVMTILSHKLSQDTLERVIMRDFDRIVVSLARTHTRDLLGGRVTYALFVNPNNVDRETNKTSLIFLQMISDKLLLKLMHPLMTREIPTRTPPMSLALIAKHNPRFFNEVLYRLAKIEGWEAVYQRVILHKDLLRRLSQEIIEKFLVLHEDFKDKIAEITKFEGGTYARVKNAYSTYKLENRFAEARNRFQYAKDHACQSYQAILDATPLIPPLADIILEYTTKEPDLRAQAKLAYANKKVESVATQLPQQYFKFASESKGVVADTRLAHSLLQNGFELPPELKPIEGDGSRFITKKPTK